MWFIILNGKQEGPYSFEELREIKEITPDTLAWKEGMENWLPIRDIPELKKLFEEPQPSEEMIEGPEGKGTAEDLVLSIPQAEPPLFFWLLLISLLFIYALLQLYS